jgi:hypothetical protein
MKKGNFMLELNRGQKMVFLRQAIYLHTFTKKQAFSRCYVGVLQRSIDSHYIPLISFRCLTTGLFVYLIKKPFKTTKNLGLKKY